MLIFTLTYLLTVITKLKFGFSMSYSQMKRARQSPPTEIPMALESTLANLASFMPRTPENLPMVSLSTFLYKLWKYKL